MDLRFYDLREDDWDDIIRLCNEVHGEDYINHEILEKTYRISCSRGLCCSKVVYDGPRKRGKLIGFRLTCAPGNWEIDKWCSPKKWEVPPDKVCYFKTIAVDPNYRGRGIGSNLLRLSIKTAKQLGAVAGVSHLWMQSPGNSAFRYFTKNGGEFVKFWPARWNEDCSSGGWGCTQCGTDCHCDATEMILHFGEQNE